MSDGSERVTAWIVSHTHWDREWYLSYGRFRVDLARMVHALLDRLEHDPEFKHFVLDGQALLLRDHLQFYPEDRARIRRLVKEGWLSLGPWYILPDEFLVSGEATVRNLLAGHQLCRELGGEVKVGYMPDSFGHLAQIPQLLRGVGIDNFIYTRGNGDELEELGSDYLWRAPDGSEVLACCQVDGYCNAGGLGYDEIWEAHTRRNVHTDKAVERVGKLLEKLTARSNSPVLLINNGCDHFPAQKDFHQIITALREAFPEINFQHGSHRRYLDGLRKADVQRKVFRGELLGGRYNFILSGVWSARLYLKQWNERAQTLLESRLEPLAAAAHFLHGVEYPTGMLRWAWSRLMENHPHDSICGCSIDTVHTEMVARFSEVVESAEQQLHRSLRDLLPFFAPEKAQDTDTALAVFNSLPWRRSQVVSRLVILLPGQPHIETMDLVDEDGVSVPFELVERHWLERFWAIDYRAQLDLDSQLLQRDTYLDRMGDRIRRTDAPEDGADQFAVIRFLADDVPGLGHRRYFLKEKAEPSLAVAPAPRNPVVADGNTLSNGLVRVQLAADGTFLLEDLRNGRRYPGQNLLEDIEDAGDEYDYSPAATSTRITSAGVAGHVSLLQDGGLAGVLEARFELELPRALGEDRQARCTETLACPVRVLLRLDADSPLVQVETRFDNRVEDHRLRALFPSDLDCTRILSDGQFVVNDRPVTPPEGKDWAQPPTGTVPQQDFSLLQQGGQGLVVFNQGLPEMAALQEEHGTTMALTLLRAVGWLSRDDFPTRNHCNAGPTLHTPDAQCPGEHTLRYAVQPLDGDWRKAKLKRTSLGWRAPLMLRQGVAEGSVAGGQGLLELEGPEIVISAVKRHEERDSLVIRVYNQSDDPRPAQLRLGVTASVAWRLNLLEERMVELEMTDPRCLSLLLRGHEITTVEIELP